MALKKKAEQVRKAGLKNSGQDSVLAHITPDEVGLLKAYGGSGRRDPKTGLQHFDDPGTGDPGVSDGTTTSDGIGAAGSGEDGVIGDLGNVTVTGQFNPSFGDFDLSNTVMGNSDFNSDSNFNWAGVPDLAIPPDEETLISKLFKGLIPIAKGAIGLGGVPTPTSPQSPAQGVGSIASAIGSIIGGFAGPVGSIAGGIAGNTIGNSIGASVPSMSAADISAANANQSAPGNTGNTMFDDFLKNITSPQSLGAIAAGAGGMYAGNRANKSYQGALNNINNLYSPNSPYAQAMRQALERKDAAAGRRSQYGTRETELAGMLTQAHSGALTSGGYGQLLNNANRTNQQGMNTLLALMQTGPGKQLLSGGSNYLQGLFNNTGNSSGGTNMFSGGNSSPSYGDWMGDSGSGYQDIMGDWGG